MEPLGEERMMGARLARVLSQSMGQDAQTALSNVKVRSSLPDTGSQRRRAPALVGPLRLNVPNDFTALVHERLYTSERASSNPRFSRLESAVLVTPGDGLQEVLYPVLDYVAGLNYRHRMGASALMVLPNADAAVEATKRIVEMIHEVGAKNLCRVGLSLSTPARNIEGAETSRSVLRESCPDILVTHPEGLDRMLLTSNEEPIFQASAETLRYLFIPKIESYHDDEATSLAFLLRRLGIRLDESLERSRSKALRFSDRALGRVTAVLGVEDASGDFSDVEILELASQLTGENFTERSLLKAPATRLIDFSDADYSDADRLAFLDALREGAVVIGGMLLQAQGQDEERLLKAVLGPHVSGFLAWERLSEPLESLERSAPELPELKRWLKRSPAMHSFLEATASRTSIREINQELFGVDRPELWAYTSALTDLWALFAGEEDAPSLDIEAGVSSSELSGNRGLEEVVEEAQESLFALPLGAFPLIASLPGELQAQRTEHLLGERSWRRCLGLSIREVLRSSSGNGKGRRAARPRFGAQDVAQILLDNLSREGQEATRRAILPAHVRQYPVFREFISRDFSGSDKGPGGRVLHLWLTYLLSREVGIESSVEGGLFSDGQARAQVRIAEDEAVAEVAHRAIGTQIILDPLAAGSVLAWAQTVLEYLRQRGAIWHPWLKGFIESSDLGQSWSLPLIEEGFSPWSTAEGAPSFPIAGRSQGGREAVDASSWFAETAMKFLGLDRDRGAQVTRAFLHELSAENMLISYPTLAGMVYALPLNSIVVESGSGVTSSKDLSWAVRQSPSSRGEGSKDGLLILADPSLEGSLALSVATPSQGAKISVRCVLLDGEAGERSMLPQVDFTQEDAVRRQFIAVLGDQLAFSRHSIEEYIEPRTATPAMERMSHKGSWLSSVAELNRRSGDRHASRWLATFARGQSGALGRIVEPFRSPEGLGEHSPLERYLVQCQAAYERDIDDSRHQLRAMKKSVGSMDLPVGVIESEETFRESSEVAKRRAASLLLNEDDLFKDRVNGQPIPWLSALRRYGILPGASGPSDPVTLVVHEWSSDSSSKRLASQAESFEVHRSGAEALLDFVAQPTVYVGGRPVRLRAIRLGTEGSAALSHALPGHTPRIPLRRLRAEFTVHEPPISRVMQDIRVSVTEASEPSAAFDFRDLGMSSALYDAGQMTWTNYGHLDEWGRPAQRHAVCSECGHLRLNDAEARESLGCHEYWCSHFAQETGQFVNVGLSVPVLSRAMRWDFSQELAAGYGQERLQYALQSALTPVLGGSVAEVRFFPSDDDPGRSWYVVEQEKTIRDGDDLRGLRLLAHRRNSLTAALRINESLLR